MIYEINYYNDPPREGYEYVLVRIRFKLISAPTPDTIYMVYTGLFDTVSSDGLVYDDVVIVEPDPVFRRDIRENLYSEGWAAFHVHKTDDRPILLFEERGVWFKLYQCARASAHSA